MRVTAELSRRRLAVALLLIALLPGILAVAAASYTRPELPPGPAAYNPRPLPVMPILTSMQAREFERSHRLSSGAPMPSVQLTGPTFPDLMPTIVLAPREEPYRLSELRQKLPSAFGSVGDALLLRASIEAPTGTHLFIDAAQTPDVRLTSSSKGFVTIISRGGEIDIAGTAGQVLRLTSWDEERQTNDTNPEDGRSFILSQGGRMDITRADLGYLGFGASGTSSGIAWRGEPAGPGSPGAPAYGDVTASTLHHNWFGAYTSEARNMRWAHNSFAYNDAYGFDPHDLSNDFVVEHNVAHGNGRHGFIFSRGCDRNIMRNNVAFDNRGHGFMIDDGRSEDAELAPARFLPSNDNQIVNNHAYDNDGSGVEIEGGTGNVVKDNVLERNYVGVRLKNGASAARRVA